MKQKLIQTKSNRTAVHIGLFILFIIISVFMGIRCFFGIEITDEAYYLAEGRTVFEGNLPYALNNSLIVGMTFVMMPFIFLFRLFSPDYEGFFLFMRLSFVCFKTCVLIVSFFLLKRKASLYAALCSILVMAAYHMYSIQNFSYNTISSLLIFLVGIILYILDGKPQNVLNGIGYFIAGCLSAVTVLTHPVHSVSVILFIILLFIFHCNKRDILSYVFGGIIQTALLLLIVIFQSGFFPLIEGLKDLFLFGKPSFAVTGKRTFASTIYVIAASGWRFFAIFTFILFFSLFVITRHKKRRISVELFYEPNIIFSLCIAMIVSCCCIVRFCSTQSTIAFMGFIVSIVIIILLLRFFKQKALWYISMPALLFCMVEAFCAEGSPFPRFSHVIPGITSLFIIYDANIPDLQKNRKLYVFPIITTLILVFCQITGLRYVYRDAILPELTYKMNQGIFKGLYTTEQRGKATLEFEEYIRSITKENELIQFRDNVPVGYLFMRGKVCDVRTWDCMLYDNGQNNPKSLYSYYERSGNIPDKIIYVDLGTSDHLSIYEDSFLYNTFVKSHYYLQSDTELNGIYKRIIVYRRRELS